VRNQKGRRRTYQREVHKVSRQPVGRSLDWSSRPLGVLHRFDNPAECRISPDPFGANLQYSRLVDRSREYGQPGNLFHGNGLASDRRLIHKGVARDDGAVNGNPTARTDQNHVARTNLAEVARDNLAPIPELDRLWEEINERLNSMPLTPGPQLPAHGLTRISPYPARTSVHLRSPHRDRETVLRRSGE